MAAGPAAHRPTLSDVDQHSTPFAQVPEPGTREHRVPTTDAEGQIAFAGAAARSVRPLPLLVRIAFVLIGIAIVVGLPFVFLLAN
jgi:hypothetical protein